MYEHFTLMGGSSFGQNWLSVECSECPDNVPPVFDEEMGSSVGDVLKACDAHVKEFHPEVWVTGTGANSVPSSGAYKDMGPSWTKLGQQHGA